MLVKYCVHCKERCGCTDSDGSWFCCDCKKDCINRNRLQLFAEHVITGTVCPDCMKKWREVHEV